ncbi:unnamed protein product [Brachionus calyciflorus]|uniref:Calponin-homology (CH) domain-containing protein n=1 Tax=Brachionus calyciflorus TaxID=104777 RepID=A0A813US69_9BILA|nr:unnamed protein product [Brachionus calyciflorus]
MRLKEYDIVIEPREIIFEHIEANKKFTKTLNIKNVGDKSRRMELFRPGNKAFLLKYKNPELPVPPGMEIAAVVEFETSHAQEFLDKLVISIDNKEIDIPLQAFPAKPLLTVDEKIDFGLLSDNNKTVSKKIRIKNSGARDGQFSINYKGDLPFTFVPNKDKVPAYSELFVRVDFFTNKPVKLNEKIQIILEGQDKPFEFQIVGDIMKRELVLLDASSLQPINKLDFGSCYYGCNLLNMAILFNSSPEKVDYVVLLEEKGLGVEIGAELSKSTNALKTKQNDYKDEDFVPVSKLVSAFPNNGSLEPFEKRPIFFRFSPQYKNPKTGFLTTITPPPRRDYAIFLYFELLGNNRRSEVAITGTALPILLRIDPDQMDFGHCPIGQRKQIPATIYNDSELKDIRFRFKKVANYTVSPACGRIPPRSTRNILVTFIPHQMGIFNYKLNCEVVDKLADSNNPLHEYDKGIRDFPIELSGEAVAITTEPIPKFSTGMSPILTNEVGLNVSTTVQSLKSFSPKTVVQNAARDNLHKISYSEKIKPGKESEYKIAFPNDRSKSIGPFNRYEKYKTLYTGADRYNYVDPDFAYTEDELKQIEQHKSVYKKYIDDLRFFREEKRRNKEFNAFKNAPDNGLIPGGGVKPQELSIKELHKEAVKTKKEDFKVNPDWQLVSSGELSAQEKLIKSSVNKETTQLLSKRDKDKVSVQLTPAQIYKIIVNPSVIDYGEVAVKSVSIKNLEFLNTLDQPIHVELETDCDELGQTNPCGQIIQPNSKGLFPIIFESSTVQTFQRSISYRINFSYRHHVIILAEVKLPSLKLNTNNLVLTQLSGVQPDLCYRSNITIINPYNTTTEFTWIPIYGEQGTAFSIRPATGVIEPFKDLECEVVWHGSFLAPLKGTFSLQVRGGESTTLNCEAKLGSTQLQFISRRSNFGKIPVNLTTTKTFYLTNTGTHNAFFQILDTKPIPGMVITPAYGLAPLNALTAIKCEMNPSEIIKFDARVLIQIRGGRQLELRLSGESEEPIVDIDLPAFEFGGIYSGAVSKMSFRIKNTSKVKARVEFNLRRYHDFSIKAKEKSTQLTEVDRNYELFINGEENLALELVFAPTEVASYEFDLPMSVNRPDESLDDFGSSSPYQSDITREKSPVTRKSSRYSLYNFIPKRKIIAIGLRPAIEITNPKIHFNIPIAYFERLKDGGFFEAKSTQLINQSHKPVKWCIDLRKSNKVLEDGIFKLCDGSLVPFVASDKKSYGPEGELKPNETCELNILFSPTKPGLYNCNLPIVINDHFEQPFYNIEVFGELRTPEVKFEPEVLILKPIPLGVQIVDQFFLKPIGYERKTKLKLEVMPGKTQSGDTIDVLTADFVDDPIIDPENKADTIEIAIKFTSPKPISDSIKIKFTDEQNREFIYNVIVTSDNSLFTCYGFLADHNTDYQIVIETGQIMKGTRTQKQASLASEMSGEPILRPCSNTSRLTNNRSVSPTFDMNASMAESSPIKDRDDYIQAAFQGDMTPNNLNYNSRLSTVLTKAQEPIVFPSCELNSGIYTFEVLKILQRWFKVNGWPQSHNLVKIPESFRGGVSRKPLDDGLESMPHQDSIKRENKTIYEMIAYLSGRALPAIPLGAPIPSDITERAIQFNWQHNILLKFLETEGGCVAHIKPDHLLDVKEFDAWLENQENERDLEKQSGYRDVNVQSVESPVISSQLFPLISKKAWLDCLLQLLKICVLNRITPKSFKSSPVPYNEDAVFPDVKVDPLTSNIYGVGERILLTWLNYCYANYKDKIWFDEKRGAEAPTRWIVNFDVDLTDSLALGAVFGAYCPFLIDTHLKRMYVTADTAEKCFHNALILIECCRKIGLDYDINSLDITDPNSISLILFSAFLFHKLPNYLPSTTIDFSSPLHQVATKHIKISNPSTKNIFYEAILIGANKDNFSLPKGNELPIVAKASANLTVEFNANNLRPGNAYLILVGKKKSTIPADTIVFCLKTCIDELTAKKIVKFQTPLYKPFDMSIEIENPYDQSGVFTVRIIESDNINGVINNPFNPELSKKEETTALSPNKQSNLSDNSKSSSQSFTGSKIRLGNEKSKKKESLEKNLPILSAFYTKTEKIFLNARKTAKFDINYLPLQMIKHSAILLFSNEKMGEFLYYLEGVASLPEPTRVLVDEKSLDSARIKYIKSSKFENRTLTFKSFVGDRVEARLMIPVCNLERENAIIMATEMRMSDEELKRRKVHGFLSSKSLLESLDRLTLNKINESSAKNKKLENETSINYSVTTKLTQNLTVPDNLLIKTEDVKSDENFVPLVIQFGSEIPGTLTTNLELKSLPNDVRVISLEFKITETAVSDSTLAYLRFNAHVFDTIKQPIPVKNNSEIPCNYEVEVVGVKGDKSVFKGANKFTVPAKDVHLYELKFVPNAEETFEAELRFNNLTEGSQNKYMLNGVGERVPALGEIKLETRVGECTLHEIMIPNKSNKKICYYVYTSSSFIKGPDKIMVLPNRKEPYIFEIIPTQRGEYKGAITFRPGEWPIKDIDSDGDEMNVMDTKEQPQNFTFWYTIDIKVQPPPYQALVELETNAQETATLCIPLSNPVDKKMEFRVLKNGQFLDGDDKIEILPKQNYEYQLKFTPNQVGKFRGSLIFLNDETGEFWYDLKLVSTDPLPIPIDTVEAEVGRYTIQTLKLKNPLNEKLIFRTLISNTSNFALEKKNDKISVGPLETLDVNVIFTPSTIGMGEHFGIIQFSNEKVGNISYELRGVGLEPDTQDSINITSEICSSEMVTINFRNSTDSAIYCDLNLIDEENKPIQLNDERSVFNILLSKFENVHVSPKAILDIPIVFSPNELKSYNVFLIVTARREGRMNWVEQNPNKKIEKLRWIYPIKAFSVINAFNKTSPFVVECMVRHRMEKTMEIVLANVTTYASGLDRGSLRLRSITPKKEATKTSSTYSFSDEDKFIKSESSNSLVVVGESNKLASEFVYKLHFSGNLEQCEQAKNSIAIKLVRTEREKENGLVKLIFHLVFCPSKSFMVDADIHIETALGGMWRYPLKLTSLEPPPDDTIILEAQRLNKESFVGFRLSSKSDKSIPFKAFFNNNGDQVFSVYPEIGELLPEQDDGTLIKVGFTPPAYGKVYQKELIISTPFYQWKYLVKGVTPEYIVPRGQSGLPTADSKYKRNRKKRNFIIENTYIIHTAVSSPIKGASLFPLRLSNMP